MGPLILSKIVETPQVVNATADLTVHASPNRRRIYRASLRVLSRLNVADERQQPLPDRISRSMFVGRPTASYRGDNHAGQQATRDAHALNIGTLVDVP